ncbi:MAG: prolipoprotein diacylglyceryl transferase [Ghiorsea sp.]|nr:prolipoprotein diacylglyceryl transferase [Ghiorsea sp.]
MGNDFPYAGNLPYQTSQASLYEMALEGLLLFIIFCGLPAKEDAGAVGTRIAIFLLGYAAARIFCEKTSG